MLLILYLFTNVFQLKILFKLLEYMMANSTENIKKDEILIHIRVSLFNVWIEVSDFCCFNAWNDTL